MPQKPLSVLIVEDDPDLASIWQAHLQRSGHAVGIATTPDTARAQMAADPPGVVVIDLGLCGGGGEALALADYVAFRAPQVSVIFVTRDQFFSDGSIFRLSANARAYLPASVAPADLCAMVEHYGRTTRGPAQADADADAGAAGARPMEQSALH